MKFYTINIYLLLTLLIIIGCNGKNYIQKGQNALNAGDYKSAISYLEKAVSKNPNNINAHYQLGLAYSKSGDYINSLKELNIAFDKSNKPEIGISLAGVYFSLLDTIDAYRTFIKVLDNTDDSLHIRKIASYLGEIHPITQLTTDIADDEFPAYSNDGKSIVFSSSRDGQYELFIMDSDGKNQRRLTFDEGEDYSPTFSLDDKIIAYHHFKDVVRIDSNSGESINDSDSEIRLLYLDNMSIKIISSQISPVRDFVPNFSPDRKKIVFHSNRDGNTKIFLMNLDGTEVVSLTNGESIDDSPEFSPDGSKIVFQSLRDGNWEIYIMNADGTNQTRLTYNGSVDFAPTFSPDGKNIAFVSDRDGQYEIYIINVDGSNQRRITFNQGTDWYPDFSPDGKTLLFQSNRTGNFDIFVMHLDKLITKYDLVKKLKTAIGE